MNLLIITQKVDRNDQNLGFFHSWIKEFSKYATVSVICLYKGEYDLPGVEVYSLGKENGESRIKYLFNLFKYLFTVKFDRVFVHMNQIYVPLVWIFGKPVYLWYVHKQVSFSLKVAVALVKKVFTASKESFRIDSPKVNIVGHGIDTDFYVPGNGKGVITVGRVSQTKNPFLLVKMFETIRDSKLTVVGGPIYPEDIKYEQEMRQFAKEHSINVEFTGPTSPDRLPVLLQRANVFVNLSNTGSVDKAVLEAMSCGLNIVTTNEAFPFAVSLDQVEQKIKEALDKPINLENREYIIKNYNIKDLIPKLVEEMK